MSIKDNLEAVKQRIAQACARAGRDPREVRIMAVTKTRSEGLIREAVEAGITLIGENRLQEAMDKFDALPLEGIEKHYIGNLQTNKVRSAAEYFDTLQSVETLKVAKEIDKRSFKLGKVMPVYIEINIGNEETKHGILPEKASEFYKKLTPLNNIRVEGIMTVAPLLPPEETRPLFRKMKGIQRQLGVRWLSAGMSNDFEVAVEEGSNMVRLGTALFGERVK